MPTSSSAFLQPHVTRVAALTGPASTLLPGTKIGLWRVYGTPKRACTSVAYRVVLEDGNESACLTVYDTPALHLGSYPRRILMLAQVLSTLEHPGVASIVDAGLIADGRPYVVTELVRGSTLAELTMDGARMDATRALTILRGICAPLMAAHDLGIVHGAVNLEHVLLIEDDDRLVQLLDWGVEAAVLDEARRAGFEPSRSVCCVAPEEALGVRSPKTDAYALGVIAYQLLFGHPPFEADSVEEMRTLQRDARPAPRALWPDMPAALEALLVDLLQIDPRMRTSVHAASQRIAALQNELAASASPAVVEPPEVLPRAAEHDTDADDADSDATPYADDITSLEQRRGRRLAPVLGVAAACAAAAAIVLGMRARPETPPVKRVIAASAVASLAPVPPPPPPAAIVPTPTPAPMPAVARPQPITTPAVVASRPAPPRKRPPREPVKRSQVGSPNALLTQYQRVGRALISLERERGVAATSELWQEFRGLKIQPSLATAASRDAAAAVLGNLQVRIERQMGVSVTTACLNTPLAEGCR